MRIVVNGWFRDQLATGSGQYLAALTEWLPRVGAGHEYILVEPAGRRIANSNTQHATHDPQPILPDDWHLEEVRTPFDRLSPNLAKLWFEQVTFPRLCRRLRADVAFVPYWGSPWWRPCPVVVTIHDLIPLLLPLYRGGPLQRAYTWLVSRTAQRAHAVLTDSEASRRDIIAHLGIPPERVNAIYLAANRRYRPVTDPAELARVRAKYDLPDEPFLLYLGGFDARKNVVRMIEAYALMVGRMKRAGLSIPRLVIAGKLPETDTAFAPDPRRVKAFPRPPNFREDNHTPRTKGNSTPPGLGTEGLFSRQTAQGTGDLVQFTGWVDEADKPMLYSLALGALFVSEYEGFGLPVLEAMGCGCGIVVAGV